MIHRAAPGARACFPFRARRRIDCVCTPGRLSCGVVEALGFVATHRRTIPKTIFIPNLHILPMTYAPQPLVFAFCSLLPVGFLIHSLAIRTFGLRQTAVLPTLVVGNLTAGGNGKTPMVMYLAKTMSAPALT